MKKYVLLFLICGLMSMKARAQQGFQYLSVTHGIATHSQFTSEISLEFAKRYYNYWEIYGDILYSGYGDEFNNNLRRYRVGVAYKPLVLRRKNFAINARFTVSGGSNTEGFILGLGAGFETSYFLRSGIVLLIRQKNEYIIWDYPEWVSGITAGIKIPIN